MNAPVARADSSCSLGSDAAPVSSSDCRLVVAAAVSPNPSGARLGMSRDDTLIETALGYVQSGRKASDVLPLILRDAFADPRSGGDPQECILLFENVRGNVLRSIKENPQSVGGASGVLAFIKEQNAFSAFMPSLAAIYGRILPQPEPEPVDPHVLLTQLAATNKDYIAAFVPVPRTGGGAGR